MFKIYENFFTETDYTVGDYFDTSKFCKAPRLFSCLSEDEEKFCEALQIDTSGLTSLSPAGKNYGRNFHNEREKIILKALSFLRTISLRIPLLIYGADVSFYKKFTVNMLLDEKIIGAESWSEFMPQYFTKDDFRNVLKYYKVDAFIEAGEKIRDFVQVLDVVSPLKRAKHIIELFKSFSDPERETVITPQKIIDLHLSSALTKDFFTPDKKFLQLNSKSGLYPLWIVCEIYRKRLGEFSEDDFKLSALQRIWDKIIAENIFVTCKSPIAASVTYRTLLGYRKKSANIKYFKDIINTLKDKSDSFIEEVTSGKFWHNGYGKIKFDAVVDNPQYKHDYKSGTNSSVYNLFMSTAFAIAPVVSMITPARFLFNTYATPSEFNTQMLNDKHFKVVKYFPNSFDVFHTSNVSGGIIIFLRDVNKNFGAIGLYIPFEHLHSIYEKIVRKNKKFISLINIIYTANVYTIFEEHGKGGEMNPFKSNVMDKFPKLFLDKKPTGRDKYIKVYGLQKKARVYKWFPLDCLSGSVALSKFKVLVPRANGALPINNVSETTLIGKPFIAEPESIFTETFIAVGEFDTEDQAQACLKYVKTKFARAMLGILKVTQHNPPYVWENIPLQDFSAQSDINWSADVENIDKQLYRKYKLSNEEIKFVKTHIKEMK
ncbi:MAG: Eco57I restriction-modification methylase domain-containing protein [Selenomonadaceae bacterium]|nr:Eco57I restriction-modification methylase domain-containing protein [Selenomonadaceae bacterium]